MTETLTGWTAGASRSEALADCCLILATYKRPGEITKLLRHLADAEGKWKGSVPAEVVVVDGSPDRSTEDAVLALPVDTFPFGLKFVRSKAGLTRQRNVGIDASSGDVVFFLDDDAIPEPDYFLVVRRTFLDDSKKAIGAIGGCVVNEWDRPITTRWRIRFLLRLVPRMEPMKYAHCGTSNPRGMLKFYSGNREVDLLPGCAFSFRREVLNQERFSIFFEGYAQGEDMEMSLRVGRRWKVICSGDAKAFHNEAPGGRPASFAKGRMEVRNRVFIWRRYSLAHATAVDKLRLIADFGFLAMVDLGGLLRRPWKTGPLLHGAGILWGVVECAVRPPEVDEASLQVSYRVDFEPHAGAAANWTVSNGSSRTA